ncbi:MAG: hypothetical protein AB7Q17_07860 [Phycisphaerae bacterium]
MIRFTATGAVLFALSAQAFAQSTTFTYQGRLEEAGAPAGGLHDLRFQLFSAASGGTQVGSTICVDSVNVVDGLFTVPIDFGAAFDGNPRFLQVFVRSDSTPANCGSGVYTTLSPRQPVTATPYALKVPGIDGNSLNAADGSPADALIVDNNGNVGVGTSAPTSPVHIANDLNAVVQLQDIGPNATQSGYVDFRNSSGVETAWVGFGTPGSPHFSVLIARPGGKIELRTIGGGGSVFLPTDFLGVGTSAPTSPVHIASDLNAVVQLQDIGPNATQSGYVDFRNSSGVETAWVGFGTPGSPNFSIVNARAGGNIVLSPLGGGAVQVPVLEITGADIAEKFPASESLEPGMVVAIDTKNAGKLCLARGAYNRCVAGVVSGANNFSVGAVLGNLPGHEDAPPIALSGRVYVQCDASAGAIEPGDLLTTSETPGYAMKATDLDRSHGAVIGKAMERLENGRGLVLALVNLQ